MRFLTYVMFVVPLVFCTAGLSSAQDRDQAKRVAEIEKEITELKARVDKLTAELGELKAMSEPEFRDIYLTSEDAKSIRGKWQAVRMTWGNDIIPQESVAKLQLEITEHWYTAGRGPVKWLERGKNPVEASLPQFDGVWRIDPTTNPKSIIIYQQQRDLALRLPIRGIYKLEGDTLTVCFGSFDDVPASFEDKDALMHAVYRRIPSNTK
jgi:uncharacterized protein (TIGR03067 family)